MDSAFANLSLLEDEEEELLVESSHGMGGATVAEFSVVGRFVTDQPIPFNLMKARMASIWNLKKGVHMKEVFCFICGKLDHQDSSCDVLFNSPDEEVKREWGVFLKATEIRGHPDQTNKWLRRDDSGKTTPDTSGCATEMKGDEEENSDEDGNQSLVPARRTERTTDSTSDYSLILNPTFIPNSSSGNGEAIENTPHDCKKRKLTQHNGGAIIPASTQGIAAGINSKEYSDVFILVGSAVRAH
ncbi:hypothetical protein ACS0TY_026531 [Phlomoides rotata]